MVNIGGLIISLKSAISQVEQYYEYLLKRAEPEITQLHQQNESELQQIEVELKQIRQQNEINMG
jgi:hypothetical protein